MAFECYYIFDFISSISKAKNNLDDITLFMFNDKYIVKTKDGKELCIYNDKVIEDPYEQITGSYYFRLAAIDRNEKKCLISLLKTIGYGLKATFALGCLIKLVNNTKN